MVDWKFPAIRHAIVKFIAPSVWENASRNEFSHVPRPLTLRAKKLFGVKKVSVLEIGVHEGVNALSISKTLNIGYFVLVDPYLAYGNIGTEQLPHVQEEMDNVKARMITRLKPDEENYYHWIAKTSESAVQIIQSQQIKFDMIYIDGDHSLETVKKDIELWFPFLSTPGILGGHDFYGDYQGLVRTVIEWADNLGLELHTKKADWRIELS
jgi:hypothetical protein